MYFFSKIFPLNRHKAELDKASMIDQNMAQKDAVCVPSNVGKPTNILS
jgi:hypothetical protein